MKLTAQEIPTLWTSDTRVMSEKAIDEAFKQYIGTAPSTGEKIGQLRIDPSGAIPNTFPIGQARLGFKSRRRGMGPEGPAGPPPGLQDPAASAANVPLNGDGSPGTATAQVEQDPTTKDLKFLFGIPVGQKGDTGDASTVPGPPPGLQDPASSSYNIPVKGDGNPGDAIVEINQDSNGDLQFAFGVPVGKTGEKGDDGPPGEGVDYKGPIDATTAAEPSEPSNGDFYINTNPGTSSWTGLSTVTQNDRLIWNGNTNQWDRYTPPPMTGVELSWSQAVNSGTVDNTAGSNAVIPVVDGTYAGSDAPDGAHQARRH